MTAEIAAAAVVLMAPAGLLLGILAVAAVIVASLSEGSSIIEDQARLAGG
jgi:hypothetical protein